MLAPANEKRPQGESAGADFAAVGGMQLHGGAAVQAVAAMVSELPAPPYPDMIGNKPNKAGGYKFELDIERMHQSDTWAIAEPRLRPFLVMVWIAAWMQVPAGSLPDDDGVIAVRIGLPLSEFMSNRDVLMRGWWKASNGRLYHPVITEQVIGVMERKAGWSDRQKSRRDRLKELALADVTRDSAESHRDVTASHTPTTTTTTNTNTTKEEHKRLHEPEGSRRRSREQEGFVVPASGSGMSIPLKGGGEHIITNAEISEWQQVYQDKDVHAELRKARQWCIANPNKQKTRNGISKFINGWLARKPLGSPSNHSAHTGFDTTDYKKDELEWNSKN